MLPKIEFGNLSRGHNNPVLIKEKRDENGTPIVRLYQREDIEVFSNPLEKIKVSLKYSLEDFALKNHSVAKLMEKIGFGKIKLLVVTNQQNPAEIIGKIKSGAMTGFIDEDSRKKFNEILFLNNITNYGDFIFYENKYTEYDLLTDLRYLSQKNENELDYEKLIKPILRERYDLTARISRFSSNHEKINNYFEMVSNLSEKLDEIFNRNNLDNRLREEINDKFEFRFLKSVVSAYGAENAVKWLLNYEDSSKKPDNENSNKNQENVINLINSAFSNDPQESEEKKIESAVLLRYRYIGDCEAPITPKVFADYKVEELLKKNPDLESKVKAMEEKYGTSE